MAAVGGFAVLAASVVLLLNRNPPTAALVSIVGDQRLIVARPTGEFRYGPLRSPMRGPREGASLALQAEAARLVERAGETGNAIDVQAAGVAQLLEGSVTEGIAALESAARARPRDASAQADLGAGYMTRFIDSGKRADGDGALAAIDAALAIDPKLHEAWFNKALLLERLERPADALAAWASYLALPTEGDWREEAIRQRDALQQRSR
jgi:tetratricopeptide (TPR) repeat protein